jgi:predicted TIM-barrel fold metal-dependent hydrolase
MPSKAGLSIKVKQTGRVRPANLDHGPLTIIGTEMVKAQKLRWSKGINAAGNRAKPLARKSLFIKAKFRHTNRPIRDMQMTGGTIQNFTLRKAINNVIRAENTSRNTRSKAQRAQKYEDMIGFAGSDQITVFNSAQVQYGRWLQTAWVPIK